MLASFVLLDLRGKHFLQNFSNRAAADHIQQIIPTDCEYLKLAGLLHWISNYNDSQISIFINPKMYK